MTALALSLLLCERERPFNVTTCVCAPPSHHLSPALLLPRPVGRLMMVLLAPLRRLPTAAVIAAEPCSTNDHITVAAYSHHRHLVYSVFPPGGSSAPRVILQIGHWSNTTTHHPPPVVIKGW